MCMIASGAREVTEILTQIKAPTRWHCVTLQVQAFVQS